MQGLGPIKLISPCKIFHIWGSSSKLSLRKICPTRVMRGSSFNFWFSSHSDCNAGFLAIDKVNGHIHLDVYDLSPELERKELLIEQRKSMVLQPEPPMRNYEPVADGKSGNMKLPSKCSYCGWKKECWPGLRTFIYSTGPRYLTQVSKTPNVPEVE